MKCPECVAAGLRSKLFMPTSYVSTAMGGTETYFDEDGHRHHHEVNRSGGRANCSNGHVLNITLSNRCAAPGCDYGHERVITVRQEGQA